MDWRMDTYGLRTWVSPFRYLRIMAYLQLPEAFRSLSRLSSALSAKASTLRSLCLTIYLLLSFQVRLHSVAISCWSEFLHSVCSLRTCCLFSDISVGLGCLVSNFIFDSFHFSIRFSRYKCGYLCIRMEMERFELLTPCLQGRCSPN